MRHSRRFLILTAAVLVSALSVTSAFATSVHFKRGGIPTCTISGSGTSSTSTSCTGTVAGLGGGDIVIETIASGSAVYQCQNNGGQTAAGQNRVLEGPVTAPTSISGGEVKNGNLTFHSVAAVLEAEATVSGQAAGCPNPNWTGVNPTLTVTDVTLNFYQPANTLVFTCTAHNASGLPSTFTFSASQCTFS